MFLLAFKTGSTDLSDLCNNCIPQLVGGGLVDKILKKTKFSQWRHILMTQIEKMQVMYLELTEFKHGSVTVAC